ncbi:MAG: hypothetical protein ACLTRM_15800 [Faecalibacillus intestinalis]|uniref:hypothetical protein n=1 Tax=Faecalibacillus intestinalis TaxID=1982626 RepID=UPI00399280D4
MIESFCIVDIKERVTKDKKLYYYVVIYSDCEYIERVYISSSLYSKLRNVSPERLTSLTIDNYLTKIKRGEKFVYYFTPDFSDMIEDL